MQMPRVGFTLLEVLIVLWIIGIAAALTIPALVDSPKQADPATMTTDSPPGPVTESEPSADENASSQES